MPENAILLLTSLLPITPNSHLRTQISPHLPAVKSYFTHTSNMEHHSSHTSPGLPGREVQVGTQHPTRH